MTDFLHSRTARALTIASLLALSAAAQARDVRLQGPNGNGGSCPDITATAMDDAEAPASIAPKRSAVPDKPKATPMVRSSGESTTRPRWHSILPGMFR